VNSVKHLPRYMT